MLFFDSVPNSYDAYTGEILLSWDIEVPTTDKDKLEFNRRVFSTIAFKQLHDLLINNGYKRIGFNSGLFKEFKDTTPYDMYINRDFDRLEKYYTLSFVISN